MEVAKLLRRWLGNWLLVDASLGKFLKEHSKTYFLKDTRNKEEEPGVKREEENVEEVWHSFRYLIVDTHTSHCHWSTDWILKGAHTVEDEDTDSESREESIQAS